jgi:uncharacterized protein
MLYFASSWLGLFDLSSTISGNYSSLPIVFVVGLTAGISTCMALVGGLVLGASARFAKQKPLASSWEKFSPHLFFSLGRVISFFVLGGVIGWAGSIIQLSMSAVGFVTILVGLSMLILGAQLIDIFPRLSRWQLTLPKGIAKTLGLDSYKQAEYSHKNSIILGGLTFFLPCGFTQAIQLFAISSGSPLTGALTMGVFALGTTPGLLGIGGLSSIVKGAKSGYFYKFAGLAVMAMAAFNISNGLNLTGLKVIAGNIGNNDREIVVDQNLESKLLQATYYSRVGIQPEKLFASVGQKVKLEIYAQDNGAGCMSGLALPGLTNQTTRLTKGSLSVFEFVPQRPGIYKMVCTSMGMYHGSSIIAN